jgi:hypothetical protein
MRTNAIPVIDPEFSAMLPPLTDEEYGLLEQGLLSEKKCRCPIVVWDGTLVLGRARLELCIKHGVEFEVIEMSFPSREDAKLFIIEDQLGRRNLTDAQRIEMALFRADLLRITAKRNMAHGRGGPNGCTIPSSKGTKLTGKKAGGQGTVPQDEADGADFIPIDVNKAVAEAAGVSEGTLYSYGKVKEEATPELLEQVRAGAVTIGAAFKRLDSEILKQVNKASDKIRFIDYCLPFGDETDAEVKGRLRELAELLKDLISKRRQRRADILGYELKG